MSNWNGKEKRLIVAAALKMSDGQVVIGVRHFDSIMRSQLKLLYIDRYAPTPRQGFVDNRGVYVSRREALEIATAAGQLNVHRTKTEPEDELFSEDLW